MNNSEYKEPSSEDIKLLKRAQEYEKKYTKYLKDIKFTNIGFYISITLFVLGVPSFFSYDPVGEFFFNTGGTGLIIFGFFKYYISFGEGKRNREMTLKEINNILQKVECKWTEKNNRYYVYSKDNKRIEADEYF